MFSKIGRDKTHYEKGQVFPFLIAVAVVIIIAAMITANLGQLSLYRTDVSNAADAAALAGASTLSGTLLGLGLKSDMMFGAAMIQMALIVAMIVMSALTLAITIPILAYFALLLKQWKDYSVAVGDANMGWANAAKSAIQYAFQNVGIDEPRLTFRQFVQKVYNVSDPSKVPLLTLRRYYAAYTNQDDPQADTQTRRNIQEFFRSGFSKFMEAEGYWSQGRIDPKIQARPPIQAGYGWNEDGSNSHADTKPYTDYENYVEVEVIGKMRYPLAIYGMWDMFADTCGSGAAQQSIRGYILLGIAGLLPWWLKWLPIDPAVWFLGLFDFIWDALLPAGLQMAIPENTDDSPLQVTVKRYKRDKNLGLWTFRYSIPGMQGISAKAQAHAYGDAEEATEGRQPLKPEEKDIRPAFVDERGRSACPLTLFFMILRDVFSDWSFEDIKDSFDTRTHLFETEINAVR
jgi:hypothetical protein